MQQIELFRQIVQADEAQFRMVLRQQEREAGFRLVNNQIAMRQSMQELLETLAVPPESPQQDVRMTFQIPMNWDEAVPVVATPAQIQQALVNTAVSNPPQNCAICQEDIQTHGVQLRNCHHHFHRGCVVTWFTTSPRCPVCRNDIRETPHN